MPISPGLCTIPGCNRPMKSRGWCVVHYKRWWRLGDPEAGGGLQRRGASLEERFWPKVLKLPPHPRFNKKGCWPWLRALTPDGYGVFQPSPGSDKSARAHVIAFELSNEQTVGDLLVRHTCDFRCCCNPNHLLLGTHQDNSSDMVSRSRQASGERHGMVLLSWAEVREIRKLAGVVRQVDLAITYGISQTNVSDIQLGKIWKED